MAWGPSSAFRRSALAHVALAIGVVACNSLVGFDDLKKVQANTEEDDDGGKSGSSSGGTSSSGQSGSSSGGTTSSSSGQPSGPRCDPLKPFDPPELAEDFDVALKARSAVLSQDELEAYFISGTQSPDFHLRRMTRESVDAPWSTPSTVVLAPEPLTALALTAGDLKLYYYACEGTSPVVCANFVTTRDSRDGAFGASAESREVAQNTNIQTDLFVISSDDTAFYSDLLPDGGGFSQIVTAPVNQTGLLANLETPVPNVRLDGTSNDKPIVSQSGLAMYFSSNRPGSNAGSYDIWVSRRSTKTDKFGVPTFVPELSAGGLDEVTWASADDCLVYVQRSDHIYLAKRPL